MVTKNDYIIKPDGKISRKPIKQLVKTKNGSHYRIIPSKDMKLILRKDGYVEVSMCGKKELLHRVIAEAFIPNPDNKPQVNHIDGDKRNNVVSNLEWVTSKENIDHAIKTKLTKLNDGSKQVKSITIYDKLNDVTIKFNSQNEAGIYFGLNKNYFTILMYKGKFENSRFKIIERGL